MADDLLAGYFECFGTSIERQRRTRNINSFRVECLNRLRDCPLLCGELRRRASNSFIRYSDNSIRRADTHRKTVDILKKSGECSLLACHSPMRYYDKSPCRADLYNRRQDIFSFWIEFRRLAVDCGTPYFSDRCFPCQKLCRAIDISERCSEVCS